MNTITSLYRLFRSTSVQVLAALAMTNSWNLMAQDPSTVGVYHGIVSRTAEPTAWTNSHLGAQLEITALANGSYTGKLTSVGTPLSFSGSIVSTDIGVGTSTATISRGSLPALTVELSFADDQVSGTVSHPDGISATLSGWRNVWNATTRPATDYLGRHHFLVTTSELGSVGTGFGSFTVPANGSITVSGKLPDGSAFKTTTFVGPQGQVLIYQPLYTKPGSFCGTLNMTPSTIDAPSSLTSGPELSWYKPQQTAADRFEKDGFLTNCAAQGGLYRVPPAGDVAAGLADVARNGLVTFGGPAESSETIPNSYFTLTSAAKLTMATGLDNPGKTTLTVKPATGEFSGGFTLVDFDLNTQTGTDRDGNPIYKKITRSVKFEGLIVDDGITATCGGFYLAPTMPDSSADPPTTVANSPIVGGNVSIAPNPDAPPALLIGFAEGSISQSESEITSIDISTSEILTEARTLTVSVVPGSASAADLSTTSIKVTIPVGSDHATIQVPVKNDGLDEADEVFYLVIADGAGFDLSESANCEVTIQDDDFPIDITGDPQSQILALGGSGEFIVESVGSDQVFQWQRNTVNLTGATSKPLTFNNVQLAQAGTYRVKVSNLINTQTSGDAELAVVDTSTRLVALTPGATAVLSATVAGTAGTLNFQWMLSGSVVEDDTSPTPRITGATTATLTLRNLSDADIGDYVCVVTQDTSFAEMSTGEFRLRLPTVKPDLADLDLPDGQILKSYHYDVLFEADIASAPGVFSATGLPAGLSMDPNTGVISGTPTTPVSNVRVVITATNPIGSTSVEDLISILPFPAGALGTFHGIVDRVSSPEPFLANPWAQADLGARIEIQTTVTGGFSGKLINSTSLPFSGQLAFDGNFLVGTAIVKQLNKNLPPLYLDLSIDPTEQTFTGKLSDEVIFSDPSPSAPTMVTVWGWRNAWSKTAPATAYLGRFNFALGGDGAIPEAPGGTGYGSFVVPASGTFNISGLMPDGTVFICNTFLGPDGQLALYQPLFKNPGSLHGAIQVKLASEEDTGGPLPPGIDPPVPSIKVPVLGSEANPDGLACTWNKPTQTDLKDKLYRLGFPVSNLVVDGGLYVPPESGQVVMDLPDVLINAELQFAAGGAGAEFPSQDLTITSAAKAVLPTGAANPMKITFTVNASTGLFNGAFTRLDEDPSRPPLYNETTGRLIRAQGYFSRSARYFGIIVPSAILGGEPGSNVGRGLFTIPQLPSTEADPPITTANAQTISGNILLLANPEAPPPIAIGFSEGTGMSVMEGEPTRQISLNISEPPTTRQTIALSIQHRTTSAADLTVSNASVVFEAGQTEAYITLSITQDNLDEMDEVFYLKLADGPGYNLSNGRMAVVITDDDEAVGFTTPPLSLLGITDAPISLNVGVSGTPPFTYQWRKDTVDIPGAIQPNLNLDSAKLSDGGRYDVVVTNRIGSKISATADVAIMDSTERYFPASAGATVNLALNISAPAGSVTYKWVRGAIPTPITDDSRITGSTTKTLGINNATVDDESDYRCEVTLVNNDVNLPGPGLMIPSPIYRLVIVTEAPALIDLPPLTGAVARFFSRPVEFQPESYRRPASFSATNLPSGLSIDSVSGLISGVPNVAVTDRSITITATNAAGSDSITTTITTDSLPDDVIGTFQGFVDRNVGTPTADIPPDYVAPWPEAELGALFEMTTTASGTFTGKLIYAGTANSFTGALNEEAGIITAKALIQRTGKPVLFFQCQMDTSMPEINGMVSNSDPMAGTGTVVLMRAWRQVWSAATPATAYAGNYTFAITSTSGYSDRSPGGAGFAACTVPTNGAAFEIKGRLPDGTAFTCSSLLGPRGQFIIYQSLYTRLGSVLAPLRLAVESESPAGDPVFVDTTPEATLYKPIQTATSETIYRSGIGPVALQFEGGRAVVTPAGSIVMDLLDANDNASINFMGAGADSSGTPPNTIFRIRSGGATTMKTGVDNPAKVAVTVKPSTSEFSGSFTLSDMNPLNPSSSLTRAATFQGMFIQRPGGILSGLGYFTLKQLPDGAAIPPQTVSNAPIYTGLVEIIPGPGSP